MLLALLLPDPCDSGCPEDFKVCARQVLPAVVGHVELTDLALREALFAYISAFADWKNSASSLMLSTARSLVKAAHPNEPPLVVDTFAGGGAIPLEALRISCDAYASDLNPVACLNLRTLLQDIPRLGEAFPERLKSTGALIQQRIESRLTEFFPRDADGSKPVAYIWAKTVLRQLRGRDSSPKFFLAFKEARPKASLAV